MRGFVRFFAFLFGLATLLLSVASYAAAWTPPPLNGHVVDSAGVLSPDEVARLDRKLERARLETGFAVVVFTLPHVPEGMTIEDVGYTAGNTWKVGSKKGDDGVILVNTIEDHHLRIETGKGVGGALTDIQSSEINRKVIGPLAKQGRYYDAYDRGTDAILKELVENTEGGKSAAGQGAQQRPATARDYVRMGVLAVVVLLVIIGAIVSPTFRQILFFMLLFGRGGGGGGRGGGGSGYGGGGGSFGGGGSSDDY